MFRATSCSFPRLGLRWQLCVQVDRSSNTVGVFLRQAYGPPCDEALAFTIELRAQPSKDGAVAAAGGYSGPYILAVHRNDRCETVTHFRYTTDALGPLLLRPPRHGRWMPRILITVCCGARAVVTPR